MTAGSREPALSPNGPIRLAVTVDDLFQWKGMPTLGDWTPPKVAQVMTGALSAHGVKGVYAFSNTAPLDDAPGLARVFETWAEAGHFTANHTHHHASLNWLSPERYIEDIEKTEELIGRWTAVAPTRYFRHCFDMWGDSPEKQEAVLNWLGRHGYTAAPITVWFWDAQFAFAYHRAVTVGDQEAERWIRDQLVATALKQLRVQAAAARTMFGRDPAHVWLLHGTPVMARTLSAVLDKLQEAGVEFISLEEAMADPIHREPPPVDRHFRNIVQRYAHARNVPIEDCPPAILDELERIHPLPGLTVNDLFAAIFGQIAQATGAVPCAEDFAHHHP
ncbi:polysaccharide deacetylase family protein [Zavarzinia sp. CC-PAN008]|uniref:polysaccharide deacetylase family protein n=1 Tax=Zavarzinia sp. CC-PAN008 TaxID=3243332 RepID=UPI003F743C84